MKQDKQNLELNAPIIRHRFFMQYWSVKCMHINGVGLVKVGDGGWNFKHINFYLELKPLSNISDEDAIEYFNILWYADNLDSPQEFKKEFGRNYANSLLSNKFRLIPANVVHGIDFLRSKGYAIPFMEYSVEELVKLGWIQLA